MQGKKVFAKRVVISISAKFINSNCKWYKSGKEFYQKYCYNPKYVNKLINDSSFILKDCKDCKYYE